ncbi:hypothetical protein BGZ70_005843 [Mortierella alpina]|uniref:G-patch domain-containing protein n=1 Tax=Mortierella alpina TaxID=64518 RepID=A0A9P6JAM7_MORAP|nr:hypothetical protein BGZ70_005843 [Mortierella alpina]
MTIQHAQDFMRQRSPSVRIGSNWVRIAYSNNPMRNGQRRTFQKLSAGVAKQARFDSRLASTLRYSPPAVRTMFAALFPLAFTAPDCGPAIETDPKNVILTISYPYPAVLNVGARDIGSVPNSILVITDLPSMVNESGLWNAMATLGPLVRIMLAKDRQSRISWGFCFAEYTDVKSAAIALERAESGSFTIQKKPVEVHYAHHGSFIPAYAPTQWTVAYGNEGQLAIYWDEQAFLSVYSDPTAAKLTSKAEPVAIVKSTPKRESRDELDAFYAAMGDVLKAEPSLRKSDAVFSVPATGASLTNSSAPAPSPAPALIVQELPALPTAAKIDKVQLAGIAAAQAAEQLARTEDKKRKAGQVSSIGIGGGGKKVSERDNMLRQGFRLYKLCVLQSDASIYFALQVSIQLQKWSTKQVELQSSDSPTSTPQQAQELGTAVTTTQPLSQSSQGQGLLDYSKYEPDELLDLKLTACLLCQRRLKTLQDLRKHQELSDLHKKNLQDPQAVLNALKKSRGIVSTTSGIATHSESSSSGINVGGAVTKHDEEPKYRDRAAERRQIFGQPDYPLPPTPSGRDRDYGGGGGGGSRFGGGGRGGGFQHDVVIPEQPTKDGIKEDNIGNRLLKSMGWKEGQGLGKDGAGIKAPIEASGYAKGVGIGAGLARKADGSSTLRGPLGNYADSAKELARRRYEQSE